MQNEENAKPTILVIDDNPANLVALEAVLGTSEYEVVTASSGPEALSILDARPFALILLDVHMPGMDGYKTARLIKSTSYGAHVPIIMISAIYREDWHVQRAYEAGAVEYISKPFNPDVLRLKVGVYADLYQKSLALKSLEEKHRKLERRVEELSRAIDAQRGGDPHPN